MMHEFLRNNRELLVASCREKVARRPGRSATENQLKNGVPMFLDQLIRTLSLNQLELSRHAPDSSRLTGSAGSGLALSEMRTSAAQHGKDLLALGFSVDQVVHDYGDLCQAITDLAIQRDAPFQIEEFRTLNACLDNAIADAVTEFSYQRDAVSADKQARDANERLGYFVHELRNLAGTTSLAFTAAKTGNLSLTGATGTILERSIAALCKLIDSSLVDIKVIEQQFNILNGFSLADFIAEASAAANLSAISQGRLLHCLPVDASLAICGSRELLLSALANLLQNAIKFTEPDGEVCLGAYAVSDRILIEVKDHCGGLPVGAAETMFLPFAQGGKDRTGIGLGLTISRQAVEASGGVLRVRDMPGVGCVFTIELPRHFISA